MRCVESIYTVILAKIKFITNNLFNEKNHSSAFCTHSNECMCS